MKFNVEIETDWIGEDGKIDDEIEDRIIHSLSAKIEKDFLDMAGKKVAEQANKLINAKVDMLINTILEKPVTVSNGWNDKREYNSIIDMIEERMTSLYEGKLQSGKTCTKDPLLSNIEKYVDNSVSAKLKIVERTIQKTADVSATKAVEESKLVQAVLKLSQTAQKTFATEGKEL